MCPQSAHSRPSRIRVRDGEELPFGDDARIRMLHTPGHTDGSSSYLFKSTVFTGDTLFAGSVGGVFAETSTYGDILRKHPHERSSPCPTIPC